MQTVTFQTVDGTQVTLPAKDYLYQKKEEADPAVRTVVFYTGGAPGGGFSNTPFHVTAQQARDIEAVVMKAILGR